MRACKICSLPLIVALGTLVMLCSCDSEEEPVAQQVPPGQPGQPIAQVSPGQQQLQPGTGQPVPASQAGQLLPASQQPPETGQQGQGGSTTQKTIQIPGLGNIPLPFPSSSSGLSKQGGGIQIPGLPGLKLPVPLPEGQNAPGGISRRDPPAPGTLDPAVPGSYDAGGHLTRTFMNNRARTLHSALVAALGESQRRQAAAIPFRIVEDVREPNAAAGCTKRSNQAVMLITSAMLVLSAGISEAKAFDESAGTSHLNTYADHVIQQVRSKQPVGPVPANLLVGGSALDAHKLARQQHLFDQQVVFVIAHELAHHYRGHTGCVSGRSNAQIQADEISRTLAHSVPIFSQPREMEADLWGVVNVLEAGGQRPHGSWNEEGALLNLDFFGRLRSRGGSELAMLFLSTHPAPQLRIPIVQTAARQWQPGWRPTTTPGVGSGLQIPTSSGTVEIPIPIPLPLPAPAQQ